MLLKEFKFHSRGNLEVLTYFCHKLENTFHEIIHRRI